MSSQLESPEDDDSSTEEDKCEDKLVSSFMSSEIAQRSEVCTCVYSRAGKTTLESNSSSALPPLFPTSPTSPQTKNNTQVNSESSEYIRNRYTVGGLN